MTLSDLILLAGKRGYMFDEKAFRDGRGYVFFTTFDGYSRSDVAFDTVSDAESYFKKEDRYDVNPNARPTITNDTF